MIASESATVPGVTPNIDKFCFAWLSASPLPGTDRGALVRASKWALGDTISVSFLDGDPSVQEKVKEVARRWTEPGLANLQFDFRTNTTDTLIRISFRYKGSWSTIGTSCRTVADLARPTMNFGWLNASTADDEIQRVVLHEFGHALGLVHEHQNPAGRIHWNKQQVIHDLSGPPNNWPRETIELNMFQPYRGEETNFTRLDPSSIMMYPIPRNWTTDGFFVGWNRDLSPADKQFIAEEYP